SARSHDARIHTSVGNALPPLGRAGTDGWRAAGRSDLLPHVVQSGEIEHCQRRWPIAVVHSDADLPRIGQEAQELRGISPKQRVAAVGRYGPSFLDFGLAVDPEGHNDILAARRLP